MSAEGPQNSPYIPEQALRPQLPYNTSFQQDSQVMAPSGSLREIEDEISKVEGTLASLRRQRYTFLLISRLPPEILSRVFLFAVAHFDPEAATVTHHPSITLSQVCHHWRQVSYRDPFLWTNISFSMNPETVRAFLQRTRSVPISVLLSSLDQLVFAIPIVEHHIHHIASMTIRLNERGGQALSNFLQSLVLPAPRLQRLSISNDSISDEYTLPISLFGGDAPELRHLALQNVDFDWPSASFTKLEILDLCLVHIPPLDQLSAFLARCPALKVLALNWCPPSDETEQPALAHIIELPRLSTFKLTGHDFECSNMLSAIAIPPTCSIQISCSDINNVDNFHTDDIEHILLRVATHLQRLPPSRIESFDIQSACDYEFDIKIWLTTVGNGNLSAPKGEPFIQIDFGYNHAHHFMPTIQRTLHALPLTSARSMIFLCPDIHLTQREMYEFLLPYTALECLRIDVYPGYKSSLNMRGLSRIPLSRETATEAAPLATSSRSTFLPSLTSLELEIELIETLSSPSTPPPQDVTIFYDFLFSSSAGPRHLRKIIFRTVEDCQAECVHLQSIAPDITILSERRR